MSNSLKFDLHPQQGVVYESIATEILFGGAAGGGKSHVKRAVAIIWCLEIPGLQVYLFRRTFPDLWKNHMEGPTSFPVMLAPLVETGYAKINSGQNKIVFPKINSAIHLCHCQYEQDRWQYQGSEIHVLLIDEITHFTELIYRFLRFRVRMSAAIKDTLPFHYRKRFPRIVNSGNPGNIGHNWVKLGFIDIAEPYEITRMPKSEGGMLRQFVPSLLEDNPSLDTEEYEGQMEGLGDPVLIRAMRWGDWNIVAGGAVDDLWDPKVHVIEPFKIPKTWYIDRGMDWGSQKPFAVLWFAESDGSSVQVSETEMRTFPAGTLFVIFEYYGWNGRPNEGIKQSDRETASEILLFDDSIGHNVYPGPADTSMFDVDNEGRSIISLYEAAGVYWNRANKNPGSRKNGLQIFRERLRASKQFPMEAPGIFIFSHCRQTIRTVPTLPRDQRKPDDVDTNAEDHIYDVIRYRVLAKEHVKPQIKEIAWSI